MLKTGTLAAGERLEDVTVRFTNPRRLPILAPLTMHEMALHVRALMLPGDTKKILGRLERAGYEVFLPGHDDDGYRRAVEKSRQRLTNGEPGDDSWRRPRWEVR